MTVVDVWGRIQSVDSLSVSHDGDDWLFAVPSGATGSLYVEFWAQDEAGNVGYRSAILTIEAGAVKCVRWIEEGLRCRMLRIVRPEAVMWDGRMCRMLPHECPRMVMRYADSLCGGELRTPFRDARPRR